jgi:chromosome segregation ATPase
VLEERSALASDRAGAQNLSLENHSLRRQLQHAEFAHARLQASHSELSTRVAVLADRGEAACAKITALQSRNDALAGDVTRLEGEVTRLEGEVTAAEARGVDAQLQVTIETMARELEVLRERNRILEAVAEAVECETAAPRDEALPGLIETLQAAVAEEKKEEKTEEKTEEEEDGRQFQDYITGSERDEGEEEQGLQGFLMDLTAVEPGEEDTPREPTPDEEEEEEGLQGKLVDLTGVEPGEEDTGRAPRDNYAPLPGDGEDGEDGAVTGRPHPLVQALIDRQRQEEEDALAAVNG